MSRIRILDGGLGTTLEDHHAVVFDQTKPLWSTHLLVTDDGVRDLLACQSAFARAGADVLLTATYQLSIEGFAATRTAEFPDGIPERDVGRYLARAADVAAEAGTAAARRGAAEVALGLGPYGACMRPGQEYSGAYDAAHDDEDALCDWHLRRLRLVAEAPRLLERVHYVAFETVPRLDEIRAVRRAVRAAGVRTDFWISCVFPGEACELPGGGKVEHVVEAMLGSLEESVTPWGIGINCTKIHKLPRLVEEFEEAVRTMVSGGRVQSVPALVIYPDGTNGEVYNTTTKKWERLEIGGLDKVERASWDTQLAAIVKDSVRRGCFKSFLVGGCCKADFRDIGQLRKRLKADRGPPEKQGCVDGAP